jgi:hypothetical protein
MMSATPLATAVLEYADRGGAVSRVTLRYRVSLGISAIVSSASAIAGAIEGVSDAQLKSLKVHFNFRDTSPIAPLLGVPIASNVGLFYRNAVEYDAVYIPAPNDTIWEAVGAYAGIRIDTSNPAVLALVQDISLALATTATGIFGVMGTEFIVGGRAI